MNLSAKAILIKSTKLQKDLHKFIQNLSFEGGIVNKICTHFVSNWV